LVLHQTRRRLSHKWTHNLWVVRSDTPWVE